MLGSVQKVIHYQEKSSEMSRVFLDRMFATAQRDLATNNDKLTEMGYSSEEG